MVLQEEVKISEIFQFSILSYNQNRKLRDLGKCSLPSNFGTCCNLSAKTTKN